MRGHTEIVQLLCQNKAEVNLQDNIGYTALIWGILFNLYLNLNYLFKYFFVLASLRGHTEIVQLLCQNKAEVNLQDNIGDTALHCGILFNLYLNLNYLFKYSLCFSFLEGPYRNSATTLSKQC